MATKFHKLPMMWQLAVLISLTEITICSIFVVIALIKTEFTILPGALLRLVIMATVCFYLLRANRAAASAGLGMSVLTLMVILPVWMINCNQKGLNIATGVLLPILVLIYVGIAVVYTRCAMDGTRLRRI